MSNSSIRVGGPSLASGSFIASAGTTTLVNTAGGTIDITGFTDTIITGGTYTASAGTTTLYSNDNSNIVISGFSTTSTSGVATMRTITQTSHGFTVGNWVVVNSASTYVLASSSDADLCESPLLVAGVTTNTFDAISEGYTDVLSGLTAGNTYFVSTGGTMSLNVPQIGYTRAIFRSESATSGYVIQQPTFVGGSTGSTNNVFVTGGTYTASAGTTTLYRNDNSSVEITGYSTGTTTTLTWGQNNWAATGSMTNAVVTFPFVATAARQTLAPTAQRIPLGVGAFTGAGITRDTVNNRLVIETTGRYSISADMITTPAAATESGVQLIKNGTTILTMNTRLNNVNAAYLGSNLAWEGDLVATDYLELRGWVQSGTGTFFVDGGTFIVSQQPTAVAPVINTLAENGQTNTLLNTSVSGTGGSAANNVMQISIPSAGTWEIDVDVATQSGLNVAPTMRLVDSAGVTVTGTETQGGLFPNVAANVYLNVSASWLITTTGAANYFVRMYDWNSSGTISMLNAAYGNSRAVWKKIAGFLPSMGTTVDYGYFVPTVDTTVTAPQDLTMTNSWTTSSGNIPITSAGVISLTAGKTYKLEANLSNYDSGPATVAYQFVDSGTNAAIGTSQPIFNSIPVTSGTNISSVPASFIYTPSANQTIKIRILDTNGSADIEASGLATNWRGGTYIVVTQLGSTAITTNTRALFRGYHSTNLNMTGSEIQVLADTETFDTTGSFSAGSYACPRAGFYRVVVAGYTSGAMTIGNESTLRIKKNGSATTAVFQEAYTTGTNELMLSAEDVIQCASGDIITATITAAAGTTFNLNSTYGKFLVEEITSTY